MLANWLRSASSAAVSATVEFVTSLTNTANQSSYTFTSASLGAEGGNRRVLVTVSAGANTGPFNATNVSVAGVSASLLVSRNATTETVYSAIWLAVVPTGTTGNIVVTFNGTVSRMGIAVYAARNLTSDTPQATNTALQATNISVTGTSAGFVVGQATNNTTSAATYTWAGATEDWDTRIESALISSSASGNKTAAGPVTLSAMPSAVTTITAVSVFMG